MKSFLLIFVPVILYYQAYKITLDDLKWENRIILYFPSSAGQKGFGLNDSIQNEITDRKLAFFIFQDSLISNQSGTFTAQYSKQIENRYRMGSKKDLWVLIGLDGGVKLRTEETLDWNLIFRTIDAMPMRQSEMR